MGMELLEKTWGKESAQLAQIRRIAGTDMTVLITGESGVGKEEVAKAIHEQSSRGSSSFRALNCAGIPDTLLEDELFGHEAYAFTGAVRARKGFFETAQEGTVLLDEIGELSVELQTKLLRALQERRFRRVGGNDELPVTARIIAATNRDVPTEVRAGRFRLDLYYRLSETTIEIPPLRERPQHILPTASELIVQIADCRQPEAPKLSDAAKRLLCDHIWPGNVRELRHVLARAIANLEGLTIQPGDLQFGNEVLKEQYACAAIVKRRDDTILVIGNENWNTMFLPAARFPRETAGNLRSALVERLQQELELQLGTDYQVSNAVDVDFVQRSVREGITKLYHMRLFRLDMAKDAPALEEHLATRMQFGWMPLSFGDSLDPVTLGDIRLSPTLPKLLAATAKGNRIRDLLLGFQSSFKPGTPLGSEPLLPSEPTGERPPVDGPPPVTVGASFPRLVGQFLPASLPTYDEARRIVIDEFERLYLTALKIRESENLSAAARIAKKGTHFLRELFKEHHIPYREEK